MIIRPNDTIAAIATPIGEGAIAIIRVSGPSSLSVVDSVFRGKTRLKSAEGYTVHLGELHDPDGKYVDQVLATVFREPYSYTGEDSVEVSCHGGILVSNLVLQAVLAAGARQADPGEFTKRAFLNGKMDLSQAEAVADLIAAKSEKAHQVSIAQLDGKMSAFVQSVKANLIEACSLLELDLDFSSEGFPIVERSKIVDVLERARNEIDVALRTFEAGKAYRDGVSVVLVGKPNAGKSSIFNRILATDRAIVAPTPGTTRDFIEESVVIGGILFKITDTAGLRESPDHVEAIGVSRTVERSKEADVILEVIDASLARKSGNAEVAKPVVIRIWNKVDLLDNADRDHLLDFVAKNAVRSVAVSALSGFGFEALKLSLVNAVAGDQRLSEDVRVTNQRHRDSLARCLHNLEESITACRMDLPNEVVSIEITTAIHSLSQVVGEITTDDVLNSVFGRFCVGK